MSHEEIDRVLTAYETDVRFPEASGMELLDMLLKRSEIAQADREQLLTVEQRRRLAAADRVLALQARHFYASIQRIADLEVWRQHEGAPPGEWWWYLDVRTLVKRAIKSVQSDIRWRHDSAAKHLVKRKARRQLPASATLADYLDC